MNICTITDRNYVYKSLAQYYSLLSTSENFTWWVLAMDPEVFAVLKQLKLKNTQLVRLAAVETRAIRQTRGDRTEAEYCWTVKPSWIRYLLITFPKIKTLLYADSDVIFFAGADLAEKETNGAAAGITSHNFPRNLAGREKRTGKFNAGIIWVRNDANAVKIIDRWSKQCIGWCYARLEDGKLCDQMYLDEWPARYDRVHVFNQPGINVAPWNIGGMKLQQVNGQLQVNNHPLIMYHFHQFQIVSPDKFIDSTGYIIPSGVHQLIYKPYIESIKRAIAGIKQIQPEFNYGLNKTSWGLRWGNKIKRVLLPTYWKLSG